LGKGLASSEQLPKRIYFLDIYQLNYRPSSGCEFFETYDVGGSYVAYCKVTENYIVRSKVVKCEKNYATCPYRKLGLSMLRQKGKESS
jgi:hypothetical protein